MTLPVANSGSIVLRRCIIDSPLSKFWGLSRTYILAGHVWSHVLGVTAGQSAKLLRVLQEGELERIGEERTRRINVRIIAATNRNLRVEAEVGRFRQDLFYRLSVFPLEIPPLRNRVEDIPLLAEHILDRLARQLGRRYSSLLVLRALHSDLKARNNNFKTWAVYRDTPGRDLRRFAKPKWVTLESFTMSMIPPSQLSRIEAFPLRTRPPDSLSKAETIFWTLLFGRPMHAARLD